MNRESGSERLRHALDQGEGQTVEFIEDLPEKAKELGKELAAFSTSS